MLNPLIHHQSSGSDAESTVGSISPGAESVYSSRHGGSPEASPGSRPSSDGSSSSSDGRPKLVFGMDALMEMAGPVDR